MPLSHFQPEHYERQLQAKHEQFLQALAPFGIPDAAVYASQPRHYRMRAEFRIWHEGDRCDYVMYRRDNPSQPVAIHEFPIASEHISGLMPGLLEAVNNNPVLKKRLYQVEFLSSTGGESLVTLVYHRSLDDAWEAAFTQPNAGINQHMLQWASDRLAPIGGDLLELYCGIGNFTLPLSAVCDRVLATEVNKTACRAAVHNIETNGCDNIALARLSSEEITSALNGERPFRRLRDIDLTSYQFQSLLADPPRAGLDPATRELARSFPNILYISCNPETLFRDVAALAETHQITQAALFDQFPYTHHMECGLLLQGRRS